MYNVIQLGLYNVQCNPAGIVSRVFVVQNINNTEFDEELNKTGDI